jgi:2-polyprenyl-3-methyl-5-hydroxy-6-metoxy-1,4-benzoquinol methylase
VSRLLEDALGAVAGSGGPVAVLDCGGGSGSTAVPLARAGARVTVVDVSADALATLRRRAAEAGVEDLVHAVQGDVEALAELVPPASFDLVVAHGVIEAVDHPAAALGGAAAAARPGGRVSVLISNPVASVLSRALAGDVGSALLELRQLAAGSSDSLDVAALRAMCERLGLVVEGVHGVGVFTELVPGADLDAQTGAAPHGEALAELEELATSRAPFRDIASRIHLLARRPS